MRTVFSWRASGIAVATAALLTALSLTGCGSAGTGASSPGTPTSSSGTGSSTASPTTTLVTPPPSPTSPITTTPVGGPVPSGFAATSVTFVSADEAFVLGTAPCASKPCTSIVRTLDRGASWVGLPAPVVPLADPYSNSGQAAVWGIRFADPSYGFVFGNGLWVTTDGGERWSAIAGPGGSIIDLEVTDGQLLALTNPCSAAQSNCDVTLETLYRRALSGGPWSVVTQVSDARVIATQGRVAAVLDGGSVLVTGNGGLTVTTQSTPCASTASAGSAVAVTGPDSLALLCAGGAAAGSEQKTVYVSDNLGATWAEAGSPPFAGDAAGISAGTPGQLVVAASSGASWLYYSADGGAQWSTAYKAINGGAGFNDLGFTTTTDGVVVSAPAYTDGNTEGMPGQLLLTSDGGASWQTVTW